MQELHHERLRRLRAEERITAKALYGWNHPANVEWARSRDITGSRSLREWCRHLEEILRALQGQDQQRAADLAGKPAATTASEPQMPVADEQPQADNAVGDEPLLIRRKGEAGRHAK
jgi:hypothetical protein